MSVRPCEQAIIDRESARIRDLIDALPQHVATAFFNALGTDDLVMALVGVAANDVANSIQPELTAAGWCALIQELSHV